MQISPGEGQTVGGGGACEEDGKNEVGEGGTKAGRGWTRRADEEFKNEERARS